MFTTSRVIAIILEFYFPKLIKKTLKISYVMSNMQEWQGFSLSTTDHFNDYLHCSEPAKNGSSGQSRSVSYSEKSRTIKTI